MTDKIFLLFSAMRDKRTPWYAKAIAILGLAYVISPIDLIPDFIPVIGLLDEIILMPIIYKIIIKLIPEEVKIDAMMKQGNVSISFRYKLLGVLIVLLIWFIFIYTTYLLLQRY